MIKYSLQNECLENIEAFTDEQMSREMAVIESVLEIYNKTILMMELSNSDVDLPDCSMFMESTFFQEMVKPQKEDNLHLLLLLLQQKDNLHNNPPRTVLRVIARTNPVKPKSR